MIWELLRELTQFGIVVALLLVLRGQRRIHDALRALFDKVTTKTGSVTEVSVAGVAVDPRLLLRVLDANLHPSLLALREVVRQAAEAMPGPMPERPDRPDRSKLS
jgi:hypothetical protein